jgi:hypothetical protein
MLGLPDIALGIAQPTSFLLSKARFQRNYLWEVFLPDIVLPVGGLLGFGIGQLVQEVSFGDYSIDDPPSMRYGAYESNFAGLFTVQELKMKFLKTMPDIVSSYFQSWKGLMMTTDGTYFPKNHYQQTIYVKFMDSTGITIGQYKFIGCFPSQFPSYRLNYETSSVTQVEVLFQVDRVEYSTFF